MDAEIIDLMQRDGADRFEIRVKDALIAKALRASGGHISSAAEMLGVKYLVVYKRIRKNPRLQLILLEAREELCDIAESELKKAVKAGEPWAIMFTLKTIGRNRGYGDKVETLAVFRDILRPIQQLSDAELESIAARCRKALTRETASAPEPD